MGNDGSRHILRIGRRQSMLAGIALAVPGEARAAAKILRVAMTAADIPLTTGQGGEGVRFMGVTAYDALVNWDLSRADVAATLRPGLALSWTVDPAGRTSWTFRLRDGVTFHDRSPFTADAVVWNLDKLMRREAPQFDQAQATHAATWTKSIAKYAAIDKLTVGIETPEPNANLPSTWRAFSCRARRGGRKWARTGTRSRCARPAPVRGW
jgi:peptide/nickel transport system substrate-binding protein